MPSDLEVVMIAERAYREATLGDSRTDTQILIKTVGPEVVVAFRGTQEWRDILTDLDVRHVPAPEFGSRVHEGFLRAWRSIAGRLEFFIPADKPVTFCGHSLGGALAVMAARKFSGSGRPVRLTTFGCPRVGNAEFAEGFSGVEVKRYVYGCDPVTWIPKIGYEHVGEAIRLGSWWTRWTFAGFDWRRLWWSRIADHHVANYVRELGAME